MKYTIKCKLKKPDGYVYEVLKEHTFNDKAEALEMATKLAEEKAESLDIWALVQLEIMNVRVVNEQDNIRVELYDNNEIVNNMVAEYYIVEYSDMSDKEYSRLKAMFERKGREYYNTHDLVEFAEKNYGSDYARRLELKIKEMCA